MEKQNYNLIKKHSRLPEDFIVDDIINRDKYIVEYGYSDEDEWYDEYLCLVTAEIIGAIVVGSDFYKDIRWRLRTKNDKKWDLHKTIYAKLHGADYL